MKQENKPRAHAMLIALLNGETLGEVGGRHGVTQERVRQITSQFRRLIRGYMDASAPFMPYLPEMRQHKQFILDAARRYEQDGYTNERERKRAQSPQL